VSLDIKTLIYDLSLQKIICESLMLINACGKISSERKGCEVDS